MTRHQTPLTIHFTKSAVGLHVTRYDVNHGQLSPTPITALTPMSWNNPTTPFSKLLAFVHQENLSSNFHLSTASATASAANFFGLYLRALKVTYANFSKVERRKRSNVLHLCLALRYPALLITPIPALLLDCKGSTVRSSAKGPMKSLAKRNHWP
jgi:hypothetical protein